MGDSKGDVVGEGDSEGGVVGCDSEGELVRGNEGR